MTNVASLRKSDVKLTRDETFTNAALQPEGLQQHGYAKQIKTGQNSQQKRKK